MKIITLDLNQVSVNTYNCCAQVYEQRFMDVKHYHPWLDEFCGYLPSEKSKILDLGCGPGNILSYLRYAKGFKNLTGIDLSPEMVQRCRKNVPDANVMLDDIRKIHFAPHTFHGIIASFSISCLSYNETSDLLRTIHKSLKSSGVLYLSCLEGTHSGLEQTNYTGEMAVYLYYYSEEFLVSTLEEQGFQVQSLNRHEYKNPEGNFVSEMIIVAQKAI